MMAFRLGSMGAKWRAFASGFGAAYDHTGTALQDGSVRPPRPTLLEVLSAQTSHHRGQAGQQQTRLTSAAAAFRRARGEGTYDTTRMRRRLWVTVVFSAWIVAVPYLIWIWRPDSKTDLIVLIVLSFTVTSGVASAILAFIARSMRSRSKSEADRVRAEVGRQLAEVARLRDEAADEAARLRDEAAQLRGEAGLQEEAADANGARNENSNPRSSRREL